MAGISSKALKPKYAQNNFKFNDKELQNQEFSDGTGLEDYDYGARLLDPQLGVWHNIDPHAEFYESISPFSYCFNNPIRFFDVLGRDPGDIVIFFTGANVGQPMTPSVGWLMNKVSSFINGGSISRYLSRPFGQHHFESNTQDAYEQIKSNYKKNPSGRIVIYGYSYGGQLANYLAKRLNKIGIKVNLLITVDAAAGFESYSVDRKISGNVGFNVNFFQRNIGFVIDPLLNSGNRNTPESDQTTILNFDETDDTYTDDDGEVKKINHKNIDEAIKQSALNYIQATLPPRTAQPRNMSITEFLNAAGIQWEYAAPENQSNNQNSGGKLPFKHLFGVY